MARFVPLDEALDIALLNNSDYQKRDKGRLRKWAKYVFQDMNLTSMKVAKREYFKINKRTNTIDLPCDFLQLSSVSVVDRCGVEYPVFRTQNVLHQDIPIVDYAKDCNCEYKCGYRLCSTIKGYVAVTSTKSDELPNGDPISFTCVDRKGCDSSGFFYEELQYPQRIYEDGVWTDTVLHTEQRKLCKLEVDEHGCVCDSEANIDAVCGCCGINDMQQNIPFGGTSNMPPCENQDTWIYYCNSKFDWFSIQCGCFPFGFREGCYNVYNISELGDRLIFPHHFGWDKVLVRYYTDVNANDLQIPFIALDTFIVGLKWWDNRFSDNMERRKLALGFEADYTKLKWGLLTELNKYRIAELRMILTPPVVMPTFLPLNWYWGYGSTWSGTTGIN